MLPGWRRLFRLPASAEDVGKEVDDEIAFHLRMREDALRQKGLSDDDARALAARRFGDADLIRAECRVIDDERIRTLRRTEFVDELKQDVRYAVRMLARKKAHTLVIALTLAIGIGGTTAMFAAVNAVLLRPLPYGDVDKVVTIWQYDRKERAQKDVAPANFLDWKAQVQSFEHFAGAEPYGQTWQGPNGPEQLSTWFVTEDFFSVLQTPAFLGRTFRAEDFVAGREQVVVVSHEFWRRSLNADPAVVGTSLRLDEANWTLAGVMPPGFVFPESQELWAPKIFTEEERQRRASMYYTVIGRLKPGATTASASAELSTISTQLAREHPRTNADVGVTVVPLADHVLGGVRKSLYVLLGAVGFLLLIACANVVNLYLADAARRSQEFAVRTALGAGRGRIMRQLLTETLLLSLAGGAAGLLLARATLDVIRVLAPAGFPRINDVAIDPVVVAFTFVVSALAAVFVGILPARRAGLGVPGHGLLNVTRSSTAGRAGRRIRGGLVVSEIALACILLVGAGLLIRSFISVLNVSPGYRADHVVALTVFAWDTYPSEQARIAYVHEATTRLAALPGVVSSGATSSLPLAGAIGSQRATFDVEGRESTEGAQRPAAHATSATPGYFEVLGIQLKRGRRFTAADDLRATPVVLINEALAKSHFGMENPIGKRLRVRFAGAPTLREIVGVVGDVRHNSFQEDPRPALFVPHSQMPTGSLRFVIRTNVPSATLVRPAQEALQSLNASLPISTVTTIESLLAESLRSRRFQLWLLGSFALTALVLAAIGIYGVVSYTTRERTRELGVRMALGARGGDVLRLVLRDGTGLAILGVVIGVVGAAALTRILSGMLFGVTPLDPLTFVSGAVVLLVVATVACYLPARRAAMLDPVAALREE